MKEITVKADLTCYGTVEKFVGGVMEENCVPMKVATQIAIAVDEIFNNISSYGYQDKDIGNVTITVEVKENKVFLSFIDDGVPFNPLTQEEPDITKSVYERQLGGLGIFMVKKTMDLVEYEYKGNNNILRIEKEFDKK